MKCWIQQSFTRQITNNQRHIYNPVRHLLWRVFCENSKRVNTPLTNYTRCRSSIKKNIDKELKKIVKLFHLSIKMECSTDKPVFTILKDPQANLSK